MDISSPTCVLAIEIISTILRRKYMENKDLNNQQIKMHLLSEKSRANSACFSTFLFHPGSPLFAITALFCPSLTIFRCLFILTTWLTNTARFWTFVGHPTSPIYVITEIFPFLTVIFMILTRQARCTHLTGSSTFFFHPIFMPLAIAFLLPLVTEFRWSYVYVTRILAVQVVDAGKIRFTEAVPLSNWF